MSRIFGAFALNPAAPALDEQTLIEMAKSRPHAGLGQLVIGHHGQLSIAIKAARDSRAIDADAKLVVYLDGQLFNAEELRLQLFQSRTTAGNEATAAELVLAAYKQWGESCFARLSGVFAIVLQDTARQTCLLVRDHLGAKSLNYRLCNGRLYFASEYSPLHALGGGTRINERALMEFVLYGEVLPPASLFDGVHTVPHGHYLRLRESAAKPELVHYYDALDAVSRETHDRLRRNGEDRFLDELDEHLHRSTRENMAGSGQCAIALSGGVDSAVLTAIAARYGNVHAINVSAPHEPGIDERPAAEEVARHLNVPLSVVSMSGKLYRRELAATTLANEMPLWHVQNLGFYLASRRARELGATTLLCGDTIGMMLSPANFLPWRRLQPLLNVAAWLPPGLPAFATKLGNALASLPLDAHGFPWTKPLQVQLADGYARSSLMRRAEERFEFISSATKRKILSGRLADIYLWHGHFYYRGDRLGNANGVEYRSPLGDLASLNMAMNLPYEFLMHRGVSKWAIKELGTRYIPRRIAYQKKVPWDLPIHLDLGPLANPRIFEGGFCEQAFAMTQETLRERIPEWLKNGHQLARMVHLEVWGRLFAMGETVEQVNARIADIEAATQ